MAGLHIVVGMAARAWVTPHLGLPPMDLIARALVTTGQLRHDMDHSHSRISRQA
jgi:hypothetical protein